MDEFCSYRYKGINLIRRSINTGIENEIRPHIYLINRTGWQSVMEAFPNQLGSYAYDLNRFLNLSFLDVENVGEWAPHIYTRDISEEYIPAIRKLVDDSIPTVLQKTRGNLEMFREAVLQERSIRDRINNIQSRLLELRQQQSQAAVQAQQEEPQQEKQQEDLQQGEGYGYSI